MHRYSAPLFFGTDDDVLVEVCSPLNLAHLPSLLYLPPSPSQVVSPQNDLPSMSQSLRGNICKSGSGRHIMDVLRRRDNGLHLVEHSHKLKLSFPLTIAFELTPSCCLYVVIEVSVHA